MNLGRSSARFALMTPASRSLNFPYAPQHPPTQNRKPIQHNHLRTNHTLSPGSSRGVCEWLPPKASLIPAKQTKNRKSLIYLATWMNANFPRCVICRTSPHLTAGVSTAIAKSPFHWQSRHNGVPTGCLGPPPSGTWAGPNTRWSAISGRV